MGIETPKYSTTGGGGGGATPAAGNDGDIQFNDTDTFSADADLNWDSTAKELKMRNLFLSGVGSSITILDNQVSPTNIISVLLADVKYAVIEYSIERNNETRIGQLLVTHNGTTSSLTDVSADTGGTGIKDTEIQFSSTISGPSLLVRYTSNSTGFNGIFKYSIRKWL